MKIYLVFDKSMEDILREEKCRIMLTFASIEKDTSSVKIPEGFPGVMLDSGGFQLQTGVQTSRTISVSAYASWLQYALEKYPEIDAYMNLDVMGDTKQTMDNLEYLESEGLIPIPVWHPGEGDWILDYYCSEYNYVALGGLVGKGKMGRHVIKHIFQRMVQEHPKTKFHVLGMGITGSTALRTFRPYSVDFSTWVNCYKFGHGLVWDKDGLLREKGLPKDVRDRIRVDKEFKREIVRDVIRKIKTFGERLEQMNDPHQIQMSWRV